MHHQELLSPVTPLAFVMATSSPWTPTSPVPKKQKVRLPSAHLPFAILHLLIFFLICQSAAVVSEWSNASMRILNCFVSSLFFFPSSTSAVSRPRNLLDNLLQWQDTIPDSNEPLLRLAKDLLSAEEQFVQLRDKAQPISAALMRINREILSLRYHSFTR